MAKHISNMNQLQAALMPVMLGMVLHGGLNTGSNTPHVWDDTMKTTVENGELLNLAMEYLKGKGFSVRN